MTTARPSTAERARLAQPDVARHEPRSRGFATLMLGLLAGSLLWAAGNLARAAEASGEADPPGRVGRIVELQGNVSRYDQEEGRWSDAERNRPLTSGDRLSTAGDSRAEVRVGSTTLRLGGGTELEVVRLDDDHVVVQVHNGSLALRVRSREKASEIEVVTREVRLFPLRAGHYRIDRTDDTTYAASWSGSLRVAEARGLTADSGQRLELYRESGGALRHVWRGLPSDAFASWVLADDRRDERTASSRYVSPEMTGAEDLDRWGAWDRHPDYGAIWYPSEVAVGWAPYRYGRWVWVRPWGWTWVDEAPWGFAPFHYGRWVYWRDRWCWAPGTYVHRPVYAPALVAWVGGPSVSISVNIGGPVVGWVPLAPREHYVPYYRATPVYVDRINVNPRFGPPGQPRTVPTVPTGPVAYTNQGVPGAVTVVPRDVLVRREPVARAVVVVPEVHRAPAIAAPPAPVAVTPAQTGPVGRVANPREMTGDDGRTVPRAPDRSERRDGPVPPPPNRVDVPRRDVMPPTVGTARPEAGAPAPAAGVVGSPGRRGEPAAGETTPRDRRDGRESREGRVRPDRGESGSDVRPVTPAPVQGQPQPQQRVQPQSGAQPPAAVAPAPPRQGAVPPPAAVQAVPPLRAQPPAPRGASEDDRKRTGQAPRHGEREREAAR